MTTRPPVENVARIGRLQGGAFVDQFCQRCEFVPGEMEVSRVVSWGSHPCAT